ncbi:MAG TPA: hypothetical protein VN837_11185 [Chloroflexota bacterium]|nr:hypothetical protein [Chloroflexota bacterium]
MKLDAPRTIPAPMPASLDCSAEGSRQEWQDRLAACASWLW